MVAVRNDDHLVRYLLGDLPEEEIERLDELSVTDEEFVQRLRETEYDLVDAYVRGELMGDLQKRVRAFYQSSERRRARAQFADALHGLTRDPAAAPDAASPADTAAGRTRRVNAWSGEVSRALKSWGLAAAAILMAATTAYLFVADARLRREVKHLDAERVSLGARGERLRQELDAARSLSAPVQKPPTTATFLLPAPKRGVGRIQSIVVPRGTDQITLTVQLESDDFAAYYVAAKDLAAGRILWRSGDLRARAGPDGPVVAVTVPAATLVAGRYTLELTGRSGRGTDEPVASYLFEVVLE